MNFLFWNIGRNVQPEMISRLANKHEIDVLMFAECGLEPGALLDALNMGLSDKFHYSGISDCEKIDIYSRFPSEFIRPIREKKLQFTIRKLTLPGCDEILLAVAHMPSKIFHSDSSQAVECTKLAQDIREVEKEAGHARTCLIGDLNMNPFETGIVSAGGLHAVMSRHVAEKGARTVSGEKYPFFYNPMWGHMGDARNCTHPDAQFQPPGTYYYPRAEHDTYFWNTFDQVMVRPDLLPRFMNHHVEILTTDGVQSFISDAGTPDKTIASDHLPLLFTISI